MHAILRRSLTALFMSLAAISLAYGDTMECGGGIIDSAEVDAPSRDEVQEKCGEPDEVYNEGFRWVYNKPQWVYILQFNNQGQLMMIQRQSPDGD